MIALSFVRKNRFALLAVALLALALGVWAGAASGSPDASRALSFQQVASGFSSPVYVTSAPGDPTTLYVVEQQGDIKIVKGGKVTGTFLDIRSRIKSGGEQGLLSVAFHPSYAPEPPVLRRLHRYWTATRASSNSSRRTASACPGARGSCCSCKQPYPNHNGGQLQFDKSGYLYVGMGDGGSGGDPENRAQNLQSRLGKLLRINPTRAGSAWQIVGYGRAQSVAVLVRPRERQPLDRRRRPGRLGGGRLRAAAKVGKIANYGWSRYEGRSTYDPGKPYLHKGDAVFPQWVYSHSDGCSITGGYVYRGSSVPAAAGRYIFGDYCSGTLWSFKVGEGPGIRTRRLREDREPHLVRRGRQRRALRRRRRRHALPASLTLCSRFAHHSLHGETMFPPCAPFFLCSRPGRITALAQQVGSATRGRFV